MIERVYVNHTKVFLVIITTSLEFSVQLFCVSSWRNRILGVTSYNFYTVDFSKFRTFPEFNFLQHKCPHVIAEPVGIQFFSLEVQLSFNPSGKSVVNGFVELNKNSESKSRTKHLQLHQLIQTFLQGMA